MKTTLALLVTLAATGTLFGQKLVIKGSDTLGAKLVPTLAEEYKSRHPGVSFEIAAEGSTTGIAAIIDGTAQIGMSSREAKPTEVSAGQAKGVNLKDTTVAFDGLAVIVHASNPISTLTKRQVEQIFTGDVTDWSAVGGPAGKFSIYTRNTSSGTYSDWKDLAMKKRNYDESSQKMAGTEQISSEVAKNPSGIGYVGLAYIKDPGIKVVAIEGLMPSKADIVSGKYPYSRPTFYYTNGQPAGEAAKFIAFTLSAEGQKIAEKVGFVSVR
jgi:phosphate transport system substrate-binding protein